MEDAELDSMWERYEALASREEALAVIDEIIECLRRAPMSAKLAYALAQRGLLLSHLERPVEAQVALEEARQHDAFLDPVSRFYVSIGLGDVYDELGDIDAAIGALTSAVAASAIFDASSEEAALAQLSLGAAYTDAERFGDAEHVYRTMLANAADPKVAGQAQSRLEMVLELRRLKPG